MSSTLPPGIIFIVGAFLIPLFRGKIRDVYLLLLPAIALIDLLLLSDGVLWTISFLDYELVPVRVDRLTRLFGYLFVIASVTCTLFALHVRRNAEHVAAFLYMGGALGVVFAGDYVTLFIFWECMALASTYLIWARRTKISGGAGGRYFLVHLFGGLLLLAGIVLQVSETGSTAFDYLGLHGLASWLILIGFAINAAIPPLHGWLPDAYPEATATGTVFLSSFTTKTAVYALARAFPGTELLILFGVLMTIIPIFYAVLENDTRRVLSYSLINQVGFMVAGIGIGTSMALNGAVAHAFGNVFFEGLLFMCTGSVLLMTGKTKCTELGGLYKTMPLTLICCLIGAASISALPLTIGFATKSLILTSAADQGMIVVWFILLFASAGVVQYVGIKIPFFIFFAHDAGIRTADPPMNMRLAMALNAGLCLLIGVAPGLLYALLPYPVDFAPYTPFHVLAQLQLLFFAALAFIFLKVYGYYPPEENAINLDSDWLYRRGLRLVIRNLDAMISPVIVTVNRAVFETIPGMLAWFSKNPLEALNMIVDQGLLAVLRPVSPNRAEVVHARLMRARDSYPSVTMVHWPVGTSVLWVTLFLLLYLLVYYAV